MSIIQSGEIGLIAEQENCWLGTMSENETMSERGSNVCLCLFTALLYKQ